MPVLAEEAERIVAGARRGTLTWINNIPAKSPTTSAQPGKFGPAYSARVMGQDRRFGDVRYKSASPGGRITVAAQLSQSIFAITLSGLRKAT